jgi:protease-4
MFKTQLNPFHRFYTIKLALDAQLLYGKSTLYAVSSTKISSSSKVKVDKNKAETNIKVQMGVFLQRSTTIKKESKMKSKSLVTIWTIAVAVFISQGLASVDHQALEGQQLQEQKDVPAQDVNYVPPAPPVVVHFHLTGALTETPIEDPFGLIGGEVTSLEELLHRLEQARNDEKVKAVVLTFDGMELGLGQLEEIRGALKKLKDANRRVYVHTEGMSTAVYALLCAASDLSTTPESMVWLTGLYGESLYVKGLLDKIGVEGDFLQTGDYKSAAEMVTRTGPSQPAEENINWLLDSLYASIIEMISESRRIDPEQVRLLIDNGPYLADCAQAAGLLDSVKYRDQFLSDIKKEFGDNVKIDNRYGEKKGPQFNFANPFAFFSIFSDWTRQRKKVSNDVVALVYVDGMILPGYAQPSPFGSPQAAYSGDICKALEKAATDSSVKAVVMRVDSPGGSAEASEVIWNAVQKVKAKKPFIVSMGNIAGSGGYYVSCGADSIFADRTTITASVGAIGGKFITTGMWDKLGVNWVGYKRGENADLFNSARRWDQLQRAKIEQYMEKVYSVFKDHVRAARKDKLTKPIEELAGGRVYTGKQALQLGLIDRIGSLSDAIEYAAAKASISDYELCVIPRPKDFLTTLMENLSGQGEKPSDISMRTSVRLLDLNSPLFKAVLPILKQLDPKRACAVRRIVDRIELIGREGVVLMMPQEFIVY